MFSFKKLISKKVLSFLFGAENRKINSLLVVSYLLAICNLDWFEMDCRFLVCDVNLDVPLSS